MTLKTRRLRDKLLEGNARAFEFPFVGNEPRNFHGEQEFSGRRRAPFRVRRWRVGTIEGRVNLRTSKQPGVALEMCPCSRTTVCGQSRNRPARSPDVNASSHEANGFKDVRTRTPNRLRDNPGRPWPPSGSSSSRKRCRHPRNHVLAAGEMQQCRCSYEAQTIGFRQRVCPHNGLGDL
jgi:hypothetical protein